KCHGYLGYKLGDVRGASGVSVPLAHYYEHIDSTVKNMNLSYGAIWIIGLLSIVIGGKINFQKKLLLHHNHNELTNAVKQRTAELELYKNELELLVATRTQELEEEKYKLDKAQEIAHIGSYRWDIDENKTIWSNELYRITGNEIQKFSPSYMGYLDCIHPDDKEKFQLLTEYPLVEQSTYSGEYRIIRPDGEIRYVSENGEVILDPKQNKLYLVGVIQDITERKASDIENKRVHNELQQAQKMESLGQLTGGIAHDFNNLLGVIMGYAKIADSKLQGPADTKLKNYIQTISKAGERAAALVAQMLAFSRCEAVEDIPVKFSSLIKDELKMLRSTLPSTIEIKKIIDLELPDVLMNQTQFNQIVMNLAINGRDAMDGVGVLTIRLGWARDMNVYSTLSHKLIRGDWIELSISDTGSGIDDDTACNIFNPFFTTKEVGKGTGMGLSVIYRIVENHSGHIILESEKDKGSTFRILFPPIINEDTNKQNLLQEAVDTPIGDGSEILVVDDEMILSRQISEMLEIWGYKSTAINNGIEALELFKKTPDRFSLLITDQTMPEIIGTDLTTKIRQIRPKLPVIICSGYSEKINTAIAGEFNVSYFDKPVNVDKLQLKIAELLLID
ncbi:MAG: response regulator, partial [Gammaproteobacteria bacterium]|nr:response regulator [Gammaproteobacteria bacterium]